MSTNKNSQQFPIVRLYTDGSCATTNFGGWCAIIKYREYNHILSGNKKNTSSDEMELIAAVEGIKKIYSHFTEPVIINLISDSEQTLTIVDNYFCNVRRGTGSQKHIELIEELRSFPFRHYIQSDWVKGHSGVPINELCDIISREESKFNTQRHTIKIQSKFHQSTGRGIWAGWVKQEKEQITVGGYTENTPEFVLSLKALNSILSSFKFESKVLIQIDNAQIVNNLNCAIKSNFQNFNLRQSQQHFEPYFKETQKLLENLDCKIVDQRKLTEQKKIKQRIQHIRKKS